MMAVYNANRSSKTEALDATDIFKLPLLDEVGISKESEVERTKVGLKLMKEKWQVLAQ